MQLLFQNGIVSVVLRVKITDATSATGAGLTGLAFNTSGLLISTIADNEAIPTVYSAAGSTIETIATLGTFATPTATKCRFKLVDDTNNPGLVELQIANARWAVSGARYVNVTITGPTNAVQLDTVVQLTTGGAQPGVVLGATGLDAVSTTQPTTVPTTFTQMMLWLWMRFNNKSILDTGANTLIVKASDSTTTVTTQTATNSWGVQTLGKAS